MIRLVLVLVLGMVLGGVLCAGEYRYDRMATTGLQERVFDAAGKETTIVFSEKSEKEALLVLRKLLALEGVSGTEKPYDFHGVTIDQAIVMEGEFEPGVLRTKSGPGMAEAEDYRKFVLCSFRVRFPLSRVVTDKPLVAGHVEVHFSLNSLLLEGVKFEGREVDLKKYMTGTVVEGP